MAKEIEGLAEVVANLRALPEAIAGNRGGPLRAALYQAAKVVRDDARAKAPVNEEGIGKHLRDQIVLKRDPNPRATDNAAERYIVTVKYKAKKYANNRANRRAGKVGSTYQNFGGFYYWRMQEFGFHHKGSGQFIQHAFMRPAFEANKSALPNIVRDSLAAGIAAAVRKMNK